MEYYSAIKKNEIAICSNMGRPREYHAKWSKSKRERQIYDITYMWNLTNNISESIYKRERLTDIENKLMITKEGRGGGIK